MKFSALEGGLHTNDGGFLKALRQTISKKAPHMAYGQQVGCRLLVVSLMCDRVSCSYYLSLLLYGCFSSGWLPFINMLTCLTGVTSSSQYALHFVDEL